MPVGTLERTGERGSPASSRVRCVYLMLLMLPTPVVCS